MANGTRIALVGHEAVDCRGRTKFRKLSRSRMSLAVVTAAKLKQCTRKQPSRVRKCMCLPSNYALVEFPVVWSELRSVNPAASTAPYGGELPFLLWDRTF